MQVFITGATGYIGGTVAARLIGAGHRVTGLVRSASGGDLVQTLGMEPIVGSLDDPDVLQSAARDADAVINAANADHRGAAQALIDALSGTGKVLLHTSGSSIVGTPAGGALVDDIFDEDTPFEPSPARAERVAINEMVRAAADRGVRVAIITPSLIYGRGRGVNTHSLQVPWLIKTAKKFGVAKHLGPGDNIWSNVHIDDVADLFALALEKAPSGAFYYAENGENSMREMCAAISHMLGFGGRTESMTLPEAAAEWGEGPAANSMGSNSRVRALRARRELGWAPTAPSLIEEIEHGCYACEGNF